MEHMTHAEIVTAAKIIDGCRQGARVAWAVDGDVARVISGTLRHLTNNSGDGAHADPSRDIRGQFVRISATFEHWLSVREIMDAITADLFIFEVAR